MQKLMTEFVRKFSARKRQEKSHFPAKTVQLRNFPAFYPHKICEILTEKFPAGKFPHKFVPNCR